MRIAQPRTEVRARIDAGIPQLGMFVSCLDAAVTDILGDAGYDFVIVDAEHGPMGMESAQHHVRSAEVCGILPMIRVGCDDAPNRIGRFLDLGFQGVILPHADSAQQARDFVRATTYAPDGIRGMCPANHAGRYRGRDSSVFARDRELELIRGVIVESPAGVENAEEIAAVPGVDIVFFGPGDFSHEVGATDGWRDPVVRAAWERVLRATKAEGKLLMTVLLSGAESTAELIEEGADFLIVDVDLLLLQRAIEQALPSRAKAATRGAAAVGGPSG